MADRGLLEIGNGQLSATIDPLGAELLHLRDPQGHESMTDANPAFWGGHAPLSFPIVGALDGGKYRLDGKSYSLPQHGFARHQLFEVLRHEDRRVVLELVDSAETRENYPFAFSLCAEFRLDGVTLHMEVRVTNRGDRAMPASFGFHPAFAWPLPFGAPRAEHRITFASDEPASLCRIAPGGLIAHQRQASPVEGRKLLLRDELFETDALVWETIVSDRVRYGAAQGRALEIGFPDTPMLGIWTKPGAAFVCVEPWHGIADPEGFSGEIWDKPGMLRFAPGEQRCFAMDVTLVA